MDDIIAAYQELMEAAQQVLSARALQENGVPLQPSELKRRQIRLEAATHQLKKLSNPEYHRSEVVQLQLV
jgi:hypothetical protein